MVAFIRAVYLLACAGGGIWAAIRLVNEVALRVDFGRPLHLSLEAVPLLFPVCMLGAVVGVFLGALLFPVRR